MLLTTVVDFGVALAIDAERRPRARRWLLAVSLVGNLGMLAYFKYSGLLVRTHRVRADRARAGRTTARASRWFEVILPAGICFYTFQSLSYTIDVYRAQAPADELPRLRDVRQLLPAARRGADRAPPRAPSAARRSRGHRHQPALGEGARSSSRWGSEEGRCSPTAWRPRRPVFWPRPLARTARGPGWRCSATRSRSTSTSRGYSDMAHRPRRMLRLRAAARTSTRPYSRRRSRDFWRRWHISLSTWLRDYLYIPLGGNRAGAARTYAQPDGHDAARRAVARRELDLRRLGRLHGAAPRRPSRHARVGPPSLSVLAAQPHLSARHPRLGVLPRRGRSRTRGSGSHAWPVRMGSAPRGRGRRPRSRRSSCFAWASRACLRTASSCRSRRLGPAPQVGLASATAAALLLMNYGSKFLYFQF